MNMVTRFAFAVAMLLGLTVVGAPPRSAAAHGSGYYYYEPPPVVVVPHGRRGRPYPSWYYGRPVHPGYGPPPYVVVPAPRHYGPPPRHGRRPDFSFSFRF